MSRKTLLTLSLLPTLALLIITAVTSVSAKLSLDAAGNGNNAELSGLAGAFGAIGLALIFVLFLMAAGFILFTFIIKLIARAAARNPVTFLALILDLAIVIFFGSVASDSIAALITGGGKIAIQTLVLLGVSVLPVALDIGSMFVK